MYVERWHYAKMTNHENTPIVRPTRGMARSAGALSLVLAMGLNSACGTRAEPQHYVNCGEHPEGSVVAPINLGVPSETHIGNAIKVNGQVHWLRKVVVTSNGNGSFGADVATESFDDLLKQSDHSVIMVDYGHGEKTIARIPNVHEQEVDITYYCPATQAE
jgi:hypothetical protein